MRSDNYSLLIVYQILGTVVGTILGLIHLLLIKTLRGQYNYCPHFTEQETAAERDQITRLIIYVLVN